MNKGLKALKKIEKQMSRLCGMDIAYDGKVFDLFHIVGRELQALDIIKRCRVDFHIFKRYSKYGLEQYNDEVWDEERLTQEEFDLLKEVLL